MKLTETIKKYNQSAQFTSDYSKNTKFRKKLMTIGAICAIAGFVVALASFIIIGVFGSDLKSIQFNTPLLISMFVLLVAFSVVFGTGLYLLHSASKLQTSGQAPSQSEQSK